MRLLASRWLAALSVVLMGAAMLSSSQVLVSAGADDNPCRDDGFGGGYINEECNLRCISPGASYNVEAHAIVFVAVGGSVVVPQGEVDCGMGLAAVCGEAAGGCVGEDEHDFFLHGHAICEGEGVPPFAFGTLHIQCAFAKDPDQDSSEAATVPVSPAGPTTAGEFRQNAQGDWEYCIDSDCYELKPGIGHVIVATTHDPVAVECGLSLCYEHPPLCQLSESSWHCWLRTDY